MAKQKTAEEQLEELEREDEKIQQRKNELARKRKRIKEEAKAEKKRKQDHVKIVVGAILMDRHAQEAWDSMKEKDREAAKTAYPNLFGEFADADQSPKNEPSVSPSPVSPTPKPEKPKDKSPIQELKNVREEHDVFDDSIRDRIEKDAYDVANMQTDRMKEELHAISEKYNQCEMLKKRAYDALDSIQVMADIGEINSEECQKCQKIYASIVDDFEFVTRMKAIIDDIVSAEKTE